MESWPPIHSDYCSVLVHYFKEPFRLQAAFDDVDSAADLISSVFPDLIPEQVQNLAAQLVQWAEDFSVHFKRKRRMFVEDILCKLPRMSSASVADSFSSITRMSHVVLLESHAKRKQKSFKEEPADVRSKRFDKERIKYATLLGHIIREAEMPVVGLVQALDDPSAGWVHLFGARRANTLKNRYKAWKPFRVWLESNRGRVFPESLKDIIDYIQSRINDGCGRTVPESFHIALALIEQLGRVPVDLRLSGEEIWKAHIKAWSAELAAESPPAKPAEMYTVAMLLSLELTVMDEMCTLYKRALAWVVLCMVWGSMRCDDVQCVLPHRTLITQLGLKMILGRSKTTGPDKRQKEVAVHVHRLVSLTGEDWLAMGYRLWEQDPLNYKRDYLVMEPSRDWSTVKRKFLPPSGLSTMIAKLLGTLRVPKRTFGGWQLHDALLLLPDGLELHFSGHSPRNFLTSVAAVLDYSKDQRAYLGRWAMGMVASEEYVRTSRQVVFNIQKAVCQAVVTGEPGPYYEDEAIERLCKTAELGGANPERIKKRHAVLYDMAGKFSLGGIFPTLQVDPEDWDVIGEFAVDDKLELDAMVSAQAKHVAEREGEEEKFQYFITTSRRTSFRRLHLVGCFVKPSRCCDVRLLNEVTVDDFDAVCRPCKRKMASQGKDDKHDQADSSSTASSSSTDCSNVGREVDM